MAGARRQSPRKCRPRQWQQQQHQKDRRQDWAMAASGFLFQGFLLLSKEAVPPGFSPFYYRTSPWGRAVSEDSLKILQRTLLCSPNMAAKRGCLIKSQPLCKMHSSNSRAVHFAPPAGGLLNAQGAQGRPLHTSPAKFLCIFLSCCYFETTRVIRFLFVGTLPG